MDWWLILFTLIVGALCAYFFVVRKHGYFKERGIPFVKPLPIFGNGLEMLLKRKTVFDMLQEIYDCHPDAKYVGYFDWLNPIIILKDPELIKSVGVKNFDSFPNHKMMSDFPPDPLFQKNLFALKDEAWKDMRALLTPAFTSSKMKAMFKILSECAVNFADHLATLDPIPEELDVKDSFGRYTLDIIASTAFGLRTNSMKERDNQFYQLGTALSNFSGMKLMKFLFFKVCPWLANVFNLSFVDRDTAAYFSNAIATTIKTREAEEIVRPDMIQLMMQARDKKEKSNLSLEDMTAQAFIFFLGGFESPSVTMSFATYVLAMYPDIQRKLQAEIDEVLEKNSGQVTYEDLHAMKYLDAVVNETLRLFPPGPFIDRAATKNFTLPPCLPGQEPVEIKPGQVLWVLGYHIHRDPKYYPNPEEFDPDRFLGENKLKINPLTYLPFGIGPRTCIANRFALMEVKLALFHVFAKCNFSPTPKAKLPIKFSKESFSPMPIGGFKLKIESRN